VWPLVVENIPQIIQEHHFSPKNWWAKKLESDRFWPFFWAMTVTWPPPQYPSWVVLVTAYECDFRGVTLQVDLTSWIDKPSLVKRFPITQVGGVELLAVWRHDKPKTKRRSKVLEQQTKKTKKIKMDLSTSTKMSSRAQRGALDMCGTARIFRLEHNICIRSTSTMLNPGRSAARAQHPRLPPSHSFMASS